MVVNTNIIALPLGNISREWIIFTKPFSDQLHYFIIIFMSNFGTIRPLKIGIILGMNVWFFKRIFPDIHSQCLIIRQQLTFKAIVKLNLFIVLLEVPLTGTKKLASLRVWTIVIGLEFIGVFKTFILALAWILNIHPNTFPK